MKATMNQWTAKQQGGVTHFERGNLCVTWQHDRHRYDVFRNGERVEFGTTPHYPLPQFLEYVSMAWN